MSEISIIHEAVLQQYNASLPPGEKSQFVTTTLADVLLDVQLLEKQQAVSSKTRRISRRIDPLIKFLQRYAMAVDTLVQFDPQPSALAWGCLRFIIEIAGSFAKYFIKIVAMMEQIGDFLPLYERYEPMFADSVPFREALANMYFDVVLFLCKARAIFKSNAFKTLAKSAWRPFECEFEEVLPALARHTKILEAEITYAHRQTAHVERQRRIMEWLNPINVQSDYQRVTKRRAKSTCSWILKRPEYENWKDVKKHEAILWINGRPGAGKSILSTVIIDQLQDQSRGCKDSELAYYFFNKNDERSRTSLSAIVSIISQLVARLPSLPVDLISAYQAAIKFGRTQISDSDEPVRILQSIVKDVPALYIVLDGLDESSELSKTLDFITSLAQNAPNTHLLCVSRSTEAIKKSLGSYPTIRLDPGYVKDDIDNFLVDEIKILSETVGKDLNNMLFSRLSQDAKGNFLWAFLMIQNLKSAPSLYEIEVMMKKLPPGLAELYESILLELSNETESTQKMIKTAFMLICCSDRPLSLRELQTALSIDIDDGEFDASKTPFKPVILRLCSPLIEYSAEEDVFRPIHLSLSDFILDESTSSSADGTQTFAQQFCTPRIAAHTLLTTICLTYLNFPSIADSVTHDESTSPFVDYATSNWCHHLIQSQPDQKLQEKLIQFISSSNRRRTWQTRWLTINMASYPLPRLLRSQRSIQTWAKEAGISTELTFDPLEDMFSILLGLESSPPEYRETPSATSQIHIGHFEKMMVVRDLARSYTVTGRLNDAGRWLEDNLAKEEERHGKGSSATIWILNSLGMIYDQLHLFALSAEIQLRALNIQKEKLPPGHLDAVWTSNELGRVYRHLSRLEEAEVAHLHALGILETLLPRDDPHVIWTINCLARTYRFQGKLDEALDFHQRAYDSQAQVLGPHHPHTLWTMSDISRCLRDQGRLQEAYEQQVKVMEGRKANLGVKHADTYWSMNDVALLLTSLGRKREARVLHEKAWDGQKELLGEGDKMTIWTRGVLDGLEIENKL